MYHKLGASGDQFEGKSLLQMLACQWQDQCACNIVHRIPPRQTIGNCFICVVYGYFLGS